MTKKQKFILFFSLGIGATILWIGMWILMIGETIHFPLNVKETGLKSFNNKDYEKYDSFYYQSTKEVFNKLKTDINEKFINNFYVFYDQREHTEYTGISIILDLKFNNIDELNNQFLIETNKYNFYEELKFNKNDYVINLIDDDAITKFRSTKTVPYSYGAICVNEKDLIIRYVSFTDYKTVDDFSNLFECSLCEW